MKWGGFKKVKNGVCFCKKVEIGGVFFVKKVENQGCFL